MKITLDISVGEIEKLYGITDITNLLGPKERIAVFNSDCTYWVKDSDYIKWYLKTLERHFNDMLEIRGHVFLNEIFDKIGHERTEYGNSEGWVYGKDKYIDFGLEHPDNQDFFNGKCYNVVLHFNTDGIIIDKF